MPQGAIVETLATVDQNGITPKASGVIPGAVGSLCRLHADIQAMTVRAPLDGDRALLVEALSLDPSNAPMDFADIPKLAEELLSANRQWLPRFFT
jgi:alpha-galactosidase/6-phospho-beta-glucosidase family protein